MNFVLAVALLGVGSSLALKSRIALSSECPLVDPPRPLHGCYWVPVRDTSHGPQRGCLLRYAFKCLEPLPTSCGHQLPPPDRKDGCAYISIHDDQGCIVDFECEPDDCPAMEVPKEEGCLFIPTRERGCITSFTCVPVNPNALPNSEFIGRGDDLREPEVFHVPEPEPEPLPKDTKQRLKEAKLVELLEESTMAKSKASKVLKDSVLFNGVKPGFGGFGALPASPIFAPQAAVAVQPVVPIRAAVPVVRQAFVPRPRATGCPPMPPRPFDSENCDWEPVKDRRHCVVRWECRAVRDDGPKCGKAPIRPDVGDRCNWIPILDKNNCIRKYECEPIPPEPCPAAPLPPDDHDRCKWVSIKDANGCIMDYECVPLESANEGIHPSLLVDQNRICCWWAMKGECENNIGWMRNNCARSCAAPGCGGEGECENNIGWMRNNCARSCAAPGCGGGFVEAVCEGAQRSVGCPFPL